MVAGVEGNQPRSVWVIDISQIIQPDGVDEIAIIDFQNTKSAIIHRARTLDRISEPLLAASGGD